MPRYRVNTEATLVIPYEVVADTEADAQHLAAGQLVAKLRELGINVAREDLDPEGWHTAKLKSDGVTKE